MCVTRPFFVFSLSDYNFAYRFIRLFILIDGIPLGCPGWSTVTVPYCGPELLGSRNPPTLASSVAGATGGRHQAWPVLNFRSPTVSFDYLWSLNYVSAL